MMMNLVFSLLVSFCSPNQPSIVPINPFPNLSSIDAIVFGKPLQVYHSGQNTPLPDIRLPGDAAPTTLDTDSSHQYPLHSRNRFLISFASNPFSPASSP